MNCADLSACADRITRRNSVRCAAQLVRSRRRSPACGPDHLDQTRMLSTASSEQLVDPGQYRRLVDLGPPGEHLFDIHPVLRTVEDRLAHDQVLWREYRYRHRSEADLTRALGHLAMQIDGCEEQVEVGAVPIQSSLTVM